MGQHSRAGMICGDSLALLKVWRIRNIDLTFLDPPFNQGKDYKYFDDEQTPKSYWAWLKKVIRQVYKSTNDGGAIYFMQREKNTGWMMKVLAESGWTFQNHIIWKKMTSAIPSDIRFGKQHQVIIFATKGDRPRVFNKLRIDYPLQPWQKNDRNNGIYVTDIWDDIRELTSGFYAGDEALRDQNGDRLHKQQSPIALLLRIILSSTLPGDRLLDPFAGTGTTLVVANQLGRQAIGMEIDPLYAKLTQKRLKLSKEADDVTKYLAYYKYTQNLREIWPIEEQLFKASVRSQPALESYLGA